MGTKFLEIKQKTEQLLLQYKQTGDIKIKEQIIKDNRRLIGKTIKEYFRTLPEYLRDDVYAEGLFTLSNVVDYYNIEEEIAFSTYAVAAIRHNIAKILVKEKKFQDIKKSNVFRRKDGEISDFYWAELMADDVDMQELITDKVELQEKSKGIHIYMNRLSSKDKDIFARFWGIGREKESYEEIAEGLGISKIRVRQIISKLTRNMMVFLVSGGGFTEEEKNKLAEKLRQNNSTADYELVEY